MFIVSFAYHFKLYFKLFGNLKCLTSDAAFTFLLFIYFLLFFLDLYKLEKRCSTDIEANGVTFDEISSRKIVCMRTSDVSQAYCLCLGHYCNKDSLLEQAEKVAQRLSYQNYYSKQFFFFFD